LTIRSHSHGHDPYKIAMIDPLAALIATNCQRSIYFSPGEKYMSK
jgi:hypothetical protein